MSHYSPFERRLRRTARVALYSSVVIAIAAVAALVARLRVPLGPLEEAARTVEEWREVRSVDLLRSYVRIDTSVVESEGARFLADQLAAIGLDPVVEEIGDGHANVWAILEGERPEAIVLHNHIDVFHAPNAEQWEYPPFEGVIDPPFLYGRGVFDMKSLAIAQLEAMRSLVEGKKPSKRSVIFLATSGEEKGSYFGTRWILRFRPELVSRFAAVLTEGGMVEPISVSEIKFWGIEAAQKRYAEGVACAATREPLESLYELLRSRQRRLGAPKVVPEVVRFLDAYAPTREDGALVRRLDSVLAGTITPADFRGMPPYLRSLFLDEVVPFRVEQLTDGSFQMKLIAHLLPGSDLETILAEILPPWATHELDVQFGPAIGASGGSPIDGWIYRTLEHKLVAKFPNATVGPYFLSWSATDARFFREAGIPSYGFSPFVIFNTESFRADDTNERINLPGYVAGLELYVDTVSELASR